jgi:hypothetical protein
MKATLEFNLPEEQEQYRMACLGPNVFFAIADFDNKLRSWSKHGGHDFNDPDEAVSEIRKLLHQCLADEDIHSLF